MLCSFSRTSFLRRQGTLPMRLMSLKYGCDIVYSEEIIDKALLLTQRIEDEVHGTINWVNNRETTVFSTCNEDSPNVLQLGSNNAVNALKAASLVARDVVGIDLNMGCPKHFSVHAGMGSALLTNLPVATDILKTLVRNLNNPITCKIRLLPTISETVDLMKALAQTGIKAIAVHCRTVPERPRDPGHWDRLKEIVDLHPLDIPIIGNGDVFERSDIAKFRSFTGVDAVMIARGACLNPTIFASEQVPFPEFMTEYTRIAIGCNNWWGNTKFNLLYFTREKGNWLNKTPEGRIVHTSKDLDTIASCFGLADYLAGKRAYWQSAEQSRRGLRIYTPNGPLAPVQLDPLAPVSSSGVETAQTEESLRVEEIEDEIRAKLDYANKHPLRPPIQHWHGVQVDGDEQKSVQDAKRGLEEFDELRPTKRLRVDIGHEGVDSPMPDLSNR